MESNNNNTLNELEKINQNIKGEKSNIPIIIAVIVFIVAAICIYEALRQQQYNDLSRYEPETLKGKDFLLK